MMASHGCGQRVGLERSLGLAALVALGLGAAAGRASACHLHHPRPAGEHRLGEEGVRPAGTSTVHSAEILNPASLMPSIPALTPTTAPTITATAAPTITPTAATAPTWAPAPAAGLPGSLAPSPLTNPPAAEQVVPSAPPATSAWHDAGTPTSTCSVPLAPPANIPVVANPPAGEGLAPAGAPAPAPTAATPTPEPASIVSALVMLGAAAAWRRRGRTAG